LPFQLPSIYTTDGSQSQGVITGRSSAS